MTDTPQQLVLLLPVRGLRIDDTGLLPDLFASPWTVIGAEHVGRLGEWNLGASFDMKVKELQSRTGGTAFFCYRYQYPQVHITDAAYKAESALAALAMAILLHPWPIPPGNDPTSPYPCAVFRARYEDYVDEPMAVGRAGLKVMGGGGSTFALLEPRWISPMPRLTQSQLAEVVSRAPAVIGQVLNQDRLESGGRRLADGIAVINAAFQSLSSGAYISALVSAAEILVDARAKGGAIGLGREWSRREARIRLLVGARFAVAVSRVMAARHLFVHSGAQPSKRGRQLLPFAALAIAVRVWRSIDALQKKVPNQQELESCLDIEGLRSSLEPEAQRVFGWTRGVEAGSVHDVPEWTSHWLERCTVEQM